MFKQILLLFLFLNIQLFADRGFLGKEGIVDIGTKEISKEIEVPAQYVQSDPITKIVPNEIVYKEREQSELFDCEIDFLGTKTCPIATTDCPSFEEFTLGYSQKHTTVKYPEKLCGSNEIKVGNKCYLDNDKNGLRDEFFYTEKTVHSYGNSISRTTVNRYHNETLAPFSEVYFLVSSGNTCDPDLTYYQGFINGTSVFSGNTCSARNTGWRHSFTNNTGNIINAQIRTYSYHTWKGWDTYSIYYKIRLLNKPFPLGYKKETNGSIIYLYKEAVCPANTTLQADGKCKMQYDWYSYHCPTDTNIYTNPWIVRNPGKDCGNPTCTNSSTPPSNNCVRVNYTCPLDSNQMCGKTVNNNVDCGTGYIYKDYRCVREEPYCGEYTYNAAKDICENIQQNNKKCLNSNETYDLELNKCVSQNPVCLNGSKWNDTTGMCEDDFEVACKQEGYVFNKTSGLCENKSIPICPEQYRYDTTLSACVGEMTFCAPDEVLNEETKMCEKNVCGTHSTINSNGRCETSALCNGTLTASGTCIPSNIIK